MEEARQNPESCGKGKQNSRAEGQHEVDHCGLDEPSSERRHYFLVPLMME